MPIGTEANDRGRARHRGFAIDEYRDFTDLAVHFTAARQAPHRTRGALRRVGEIYEMGFVELRVQRDGKESESAAAREIAYLQRFDEAVAARRENSPAALRREYRPFGRDGEVGDRTVAIGDHI